MKKLLLIPILTLTACAGHTPRSTSVPAPVRPSVAASAGALRSSEQLREYRFGRYADPGDPLVMHESHPVYRVETEAAWNLRPSTRSSARQQVKRATPSVSSNDAVVAEVNKQRAATRAMTEQTVALNRHLGEMAQSTAHTQELAKQNLTLKREVAGLRERLDAVDSKLREQKPSTTDRPQPRSDDKW